MLKLESGDLTEVPTHETPTAPTKDSDTERNLESLFGDLQLESVSPPMRNLLNALLLYKSMFVGPWFAALSAQVDPETNAAYMTIASETLDQAHAAADLIKRWDASPRAETSQAVADKVMIKLLDDMLQLKRSSTEVFLGAGLTSPTDEMRKAFLDLADVDRRHAEVLRKLLGGPASPRQMASDPPRPTGSSDAIHTGPFSPGGTAGTIQRALDRLRADGHEPVRLVLSNIALRHLRDEGGIKPNQGEAFGVPVDIDAAWDGEAFAITSRSRVSLAELATEMAASRGQSAAP